MSPAVSAVQFATDADVMWQGFPAVIVASGPSLTDQQCEFIIERRAADSCRVIVVNDNYLKVRNADALYAGDYRWWMKHDRNIKNLVPKIPRWSIENRNGAEWGCKVIPSKAGVTLPDADGKLVNRGHSSGFVAAQMAMVWGSKHIILVGMDCKRGKNGAAHWFGDHPKELPTPQPCEMWAAEWSAIARPAAERGINLVNCSLDTAITLIRRSTLEKELCTKATQQRMADLHTRAYPDIQE